MNTIPKSDGGLRPLALGEFFVKLACKYCFALDAVNFPGIFEPIQLAICCPGGSERAVLTMQAKMETNPDGFITIFVDSSNINAYNTADRAMMLESVYNDDNLSSLWRAFSFCYAQPSQLLLREQGVILDTIVSAQGGRQGCVLSGLGYAHLFQPAYLNCVRGLKNTTARAVMDDLAITGPPDEVFAAFVAYKRDAEARGVLVNVDKTFVVQAVGTLSADTLARAATSGIDADHVLVGNHNYVGGYIGVDDVAGQEFLRGKLDKQKAIARAIRDPDFPLHLALNVAKIHVLPRPIFYLRCLPYRVTLAPLHEFDTVLRAAILRRTGLPHDLPPSALLSLHQPVGNGGIGLRSLADICSAGKWSAAAAVAADVQEFVDESDELLPFVRDRKAAYRDLVDAGARTLDDSFTTYYDIQLNDYEKKAFGPYVDARLQYLPSSPTNIHTFYKGERKAFTSNFVEISYLF